MKTQWYRQLRWKLIVSHLLIGVVTVCVMIATIYFLTNVGFLRDPLPIVDETGQLIQPPHAPHAPLATTELEEQREYFRSVMRDALLVAAFAALEAALIVSLSISTRIVEPLQTISAVSRRLAQGFYHERTNIKSDDELAELSRSVNQLAEALEQTEQRRLALLADVAHELRNPLATIGGYMEGLIDGVIKPEEHTFRLVLHESVRLQRLVEDLQLLSRAEAGQIPIMPRLVGLRGVLQHVAEHFQPQFAAHEVTFQLVLPDILPTVHIDRDRIDQVLINLLTNALRYTPSGGSVILQATVEADFVVVTVEDTGIGIAPEHLPHLFERFYRVDKSRARASGGSGVGLTIARHLVDAHGGEIWATSPGVGRGATFHVTLPRTPITVPSSRATVVTGEGLHPAQP